MTPQKLTGIKTGIDLDHPNEVVEVSALGVKWEPLIRTTAIIVRTSHTLHTPARRKLHGRYQSQFQPEETGAAQGQT